MAYRNEVRSRAILCTYGVVVTYDLAKVRSRVRIPLGALLDGSANILFCIEEHGVSGSSPELGTIPQLAQLVEHVISPSSFGLVVQWLTRRLVTPKNVGSIPTEVASA